MDSLKSLQQVAKRLEPRFQTELDQYRFDGIVNQAIISYNTFEKLMMEDGWIMSDKTVQQKWKVLKTNGILVDMPYKPDRAYVSIKDLAKTLGYVAYTEEKNKKIIFSDTSEQLQEASQ